MPPVAINGDLFLVASAWADTQLPEGAFRPKDPPAGTSVIVRHPDAMLQKVLTVRELVDTGVLYSAFGRSSKGLAPGKRSSACLTESANYRPARIAQLGLSAFVTHTNGT